MDGKTLNSYFDRRFFGASDIEKLEAKNLEMPSPNPPTLVDDPESPIVAQSYRRIDAVWEEGEGDEKKENTLTVRVNDDGEGLWIPYLGNGIPGFGVDKRGLGTFTPFIPLVAPADDPKKPITWVATGPFSGCFAPSFTRSDGARAFAHVITPAAGRTAANPKDQTQAIANLLSEGGEAITDPTPGEKVTAEKGLGYIFWTLIDGEWCSRITQVVGTDVKEVGKKKKL